MRFLGCQFWLLKFFSTVFWEHCLFELSTRAIVTSLFTDNSPAMCLHGLPKLRTHCFEPKKSPLTILMRFSPMPIPPMIANVFCNNVVTSSTDAAKASVPAFRFSKSSLNLLYFHSSFAAFKARPTKPCKSFTFTSNLFCSYAIRS